MKLRIIAEILPMVRCASSRCSLRKSRACIVSGCGGTIDDIGSGLNSRAMTQQKLLRGYVRPNRCLISSPMLSHSRPCPGMTQDKAPFENRALWQVDFRG
jgi:hypothetical protein